MREHGKKIDTLVVDLGTKRVTLDLRYDREDKNGKPFGVRYNDEMFWGATVQDLEKRVRELAQLTEKLKYERVIVVEFSISSESHRTLTLDDLRGDSCVYPTGFSLSFEAYDITEAWRDEKEDGDYGIGEWCYMRQALEEDDEKAPGQLKTLYQPERKWIYLDHDEREKLRKKKKVDLSRYPFQGTVPWTPERWARLLALRAAMRQLVLNIGDAVASPAAVVLMLDGTTPLLLGGR